VGRWKPGRSRRTKIDGQFAAREIKMLESPVFRVLSLSARRALDRIEIELAHHGGTNNGRLPVTYDDFERYGMDRHAIAPAIRELVALGLIEVTEQGRAGNADWRAPNRFRLTYKATRGADPTHEWKRIYTNELAEKIAKAARNASPREPRRAKSANTIPVKKNSDVGVENAHRALVPKSPTTAQGEKTPLLSISRGGVQQVGRRQRTRVRLVLKN
jgi:hypothetical protein